MFYWLNTIDTALQPIDGLHRVSLMALPYLTAAWQLVTAEKTRRIVRAVGGGDLGTGDDLSRGDG